MKYKLRVLFSGAILFFSFLIFLGSITTAWFISNRITASYGMSVKIESTQNLVIGKTKQQLSQIQTLTQDWFHTSFNLPSYSLFPSTHYDDNIFNLRYVTNTEQVDLTSGKAKQNCQLVYQSVNASNSNKYFKDYIVYIASFGGQLTINQLSVQISSDIINTSLKATSIDLYLQGQYISTVNLDNNQAVIINDQYIIPQNYDDAVQVLMRTYFDGELQASGRTYINSNQICFDDLQVQISVIFTAQ